MNGETKGRLKRGPPVWVKDNPRCAKLRTAGVAGMAGIEPARAESKSAQMYCYHAVFLIITHQLRKTILFFRLNLEK